MKKIYLIFVALVIVSCEPEAKIDYAIISLEEYSAQSTRHPGWSVW